MPAQRASAAVKNMAATDQKATSCSSQMKQSTSLNTPFYTWVVSPVCDRVCAFLPSWLLPDAISFAALCCATTAAYLCCAVQDNPNKGAALSFSAVFWALYGILDNLDGKQVSNLFI